MTRRKPDKSTRHHRKPRFYGGDGTNGNISRVSDKMHKAYHLLFAWAHPAAMVAGILNAQWLCHREVLVPIPTEKLPEVLAFLESIGCPVHEDEIGITDTHRILCSGDEVADDAK